MNREQALPYVSLAVDDALSPRDVEDAPPNARLVGWQCGFEPMFVVVWSYMEGVKLTDEEAIEIATELLVECGWLLADEPVNPDYVI